MSGQWIEGLGWRDSGPEETPLTVEMLIRILDATSRVCAGFNGSCDAVIPTDDFRKQLAAKLVATK